MLIKWAAQQICVAIEYKTVSSMVIYGVLLQSMLYLEVGADISRIANCLLRKALYHFPTSSCASPLTSSICPETEGLVHDSTPGVGICAPRTSCPIGEVPVLDLEGGVRCSCPYGTHRMEGSCHHVFTRAGCRKGTLLLPENFKFGHKVCSHKFSCTASHKCKSYQVTKREIEGKMTEVESKYLKELVCQKKSKSICCPDSNSESLLSVEVILSSLLPPTASCRRNPCPQGQWPWQIENGPAKCLKKGEGVENCRGSLVEESGWILCSIFDAINVLEDSKKNCGRRRRWKYGRCVRVF